MIYTILFAFLIRIFFLNKSFKLFIYPCGNFFHVRYSHSCFRLTNLKVVRITSFNTIVIQPQTTLLYIITNTTI